MLTQRNLEVLFLEHPRVAGHDVFKGAELERVKARTKQGRVQLEQLFQRRVGAPGGTGHRARTPVAGWLRASHRGNNARHGDFRSGFGHLGQHKNGTPDCNAQMPRRRSLADRGKIGP